MLTLRLADRFVVGLLAMGALFGRTPTTPSTFEHKVATPPANASAPFLSVSTSFMDLPRTPHSALVRPSDKQFSTYSGLGGGKAAQRRPVLKVGVSL